MTTHLIRFFRFKSGAPVYAVIVDIDATEAICRAHAYAAGRDPDCPCCRDHCRQHLAVVRAYELELEPRIGVKVRADVADVTGDPRVRAEHKNRVLGNDRFARELAADAPQASTRH